MVDIITFAPISNYCSIGNMLTPRWRFLTFRIHVYVMEPLSFKATLNFLTI
jgi:hypothetical protein